MRRALFSSTILALAVAHAAVAQSAIDISTPFSEPGAVRAITVAKSAEPTVRRAEPVRRATAVRQERTRQPAPMPTGNAAGAAFRAGDSFQLRMTGMPAEDAQMYSLDFTIGGDGFINVPLGGQVRAAGLTQSQLERAIEKKLIDEGIFRWPTATINVAMTVRFVTVGGNVRAPNRLAWSPDLTILAAVSAQGGPGDFAGDKIILIRNGTPQRFSMKALKRDPSKDPKLLPGDQLDLQ